MKYFKAFFYSGVSGLVSLVLINLFGTYIKVSLSLSVINMLCSFILGVPGVISLLIFENLII